MRINAAKILMAAIVLTSLVVILWGYFNYTSKLDKTHPELLYELTATDPLFYSPALDSNILKRTFTALERNEEEFKNIIIRKYDYLSRRREINNSATISANEKTENFMFGENSGLRRGKTFMHPLGFLKLLPVIAEDTKKFFETGKARDAARLLDDYEIIVKEYEASAKEQLRNLKQMKELLGSADRRYLTLTSATNLNILLYDFSLIVKNAAQLKKEIESRKKCFWKGVCENPESRPSLPGEAKPYSTIPTNAAKNNQFISVPRPTLIPDDLLTIKGFAAERLGPFEIRTSCFGNPAADSQKPIRSVYLFITRDGGFSPKLAEENFYFDLSHDKTTFGKKMLEDGIKYDFQPDGENYICVNLEYWFDLSLASKGDKLAYFPEMLKEIAENLEAITATQFTNETLPQPDFLLATRSDYAVSYLTAIPSIWRIREKPKFIEDGGSLINYYKTYSELKKQMGDDEIRNFHFDSFKARKEMIKALNPSR